MSYFATFLVPEPENVRIDYGTGLTLKMTISWKACEHETHIAFRTSAGARLVKIALGGSGKYEFFSDDNPSVFETNFEGFSIYHKANSLSRAIGNLI